MASAEGRDGGGAKRQEGGGSDARAGGPMMVLGIGNTGPKGTTYPAATATHAEVVADCARFEKTLHAVFVYLGAYARLPRVSGQVLDVHLLYKQVTSYGGVVAVCQNKKWNDVCEPFNFPVTFTARAFNMRKHYLTLLFHYEQIYYWRNSGPVQDPEEVVLGRKRLEHEEPAAAAAAAAPPPLPAMALTLEQRQHARLVQALDWGAAGTGFSGNVDGSDDRGLLVSVTVGGIRAQGLLVLTSSSGRAVQLPAAGNDQRRHHAHPAQQQQQTVRPLSHSKGGARHALVLDHSYQDGVIPAPVQVLQITTAGAAAAVQQQQQPDLPPLPEPFKTPFQHFCDIMREHVHAKHPSIQAGELQQLLQAMWSQSTTEERAPFAKLAAAGRDRHEAEMREYQQARAGLLLRAAGHASVGQQQQQAAASAAVTLGTAAQPPLKRLKMQPGEDDARPAPLLLSLNGNGGGGAAYVASAAMPRSMPLVLSTNSNGAASLGVSNNGGGGGASGSGVVYMQQTTAAPVAARGSEPMQQSQVLQTYITLPTNGQLPPGMQIVYASAPGVSASVPLSSSPSSAAVAAFGHHAQPIYLTSPSESGAAAAGAAAAYLPTSGGLVIDASMGNGGAPAPFVFNLTQGSNGSYTAVVPTNGSNVPAAPAAAAPEQGGDK